MPLIYLDHNATTALDPEVQAEMEACQRLAWGNPSSIHGAGQAARRIIDQARARVARFIGARPEEIIFTSGGTESDNLALLGAMAAAGRTRPHLITTAIEHQAVLNVARHLAQTGSRVTFLPVAETGVLNPDIFLAALGAGTALASVMLANNDTGTIEPVAALAAGAHARGVLFHSDAVQAAGKIPIDVNVLGVDLLSLSAHKLHGPKGIGALFVRQGTKLAPLFFGGHQEHGLRPGTENVPAIAGLGKACELGSQRLAEDARRITELRLAFERALGERIPGVVINGAGAPRLPNTSNVEFPAIDAEMLVINLDLLGVAASTGAACLTVDHEPSHVLLAMGRSPEAARSAVRFSLGRETTGEEMAQTVELLARALGSMRRGKL